MKVHHNTIASEYNKYINAAIQITLFIYCPNSHIKTLLTSWASLDYIIAKNNLISFSLIDINQNIISNFSLFLWSLFVHIFFLDSLVSGHYNLSVWGVLCYNTQDRKSRYWFYIEQYKQFSMSCSVPREKSHSNLSLLNNPRFY